MASRGGRSSGAKPTRAQILAELNPSGTPLPPALTEASDDELFMVWNLHRSAVAAGNTPAQRRAALSASEERLRQVSADGEGVCELGKIATGFGTGDRVRLHSLKAAADLNGRTGEVIDWNVDSQRLVVKLDGDAKVVNAKPINLELLPDSEQSEGAVATAGRKRSGGIAAPAPVVPGPSSNSERRDKASKASVSTSAGEMIKEASKKCAQWRGDEESEGLEEDWGDPMFCEAIREPFEDTEAGHPYSADGRSPQVLAALKEYGFDMEKLTCLEDFQQLPHPCFERELRLRNGNLSKLPSVKDIAKVVKSCEYIAEDYSGRTDAEITRRVLSVGGDHYYSFCLRDLREPESWWHCRRCGACRKWRDWHCKSCDKCQYGQSMPCQDCTPELFARRVAWDHLDGAFLSRSDF
jgi:ribosomal protein L21E